MRRTFCPGRGHSRTATFGGAVVKLLRNSCTVHKALDTGILPEASVVNAERLGAAIPAGVWSAPGDAHSLRLIPKASRGVAGALATAGPARTCPAGFTACPRASVPRATSHPYTRAGCRTPTAGTSIAHSAPTLASRTVPAALGLADANPACAGRHEAARTPRAAAGQTTYADGTKGIGSECWESEGGTQGADTERTVCVLHDDGSTGGLVRASEAMRRGTQVTSPRPLVPDASFQIHVVLAQGRACTARPRTRARVMKAPTERLRRAPSKKILRGAHRRVLREDVEVEEVLPRPNEDNRRHGRREETHVSPPHPTMGRRVRARGGTRRSARAWRPAARTAADEDQGGSARLGATE